MFQNFAADWGEWYLTVVCGVHFCRLFSRLQIYLQSSSHPVILQLCMIYEYIFESFLMMLLLGFQLGLGPVLVPPCCPTCTAVLLYLHIEFYGWHIWYIILSLYGNSPESSVNTHSYCRFSIFDISRGSFVSVSPSRSIDIATLSFRLPLIYDKNI